VKPAAFARWISGARTARVAFVLSMTNERPERRHSSTFAASRSAVPKTSRLMWIRSLGRVRRSPGRRPASSPAPYKGLAAFEAEDAEWFFGRAELAERLTGMVMAPPSGLLVTVTGASGSGKSSLLRAGLIAGIRRAPGGEQNQRPVLLFTPGAAPLSVLSAQLAITAQPACGSVPDHPVVVVVDQFEEVFTTCPDESERREFIRALGELADLHCVVIGLRADFYGHALRYSQLTRSLQHRQVVVGPMTQAELFEAITEPARRARLSLDPGLAHLLLHDLAPAGTLDDLGAVGHEAGALPLLSHALRATWERRQGSRLTVAGYQAAGGIRDAVARTAEAAYAALAESDREEAFADRYAEWSAGMTAFDHQIAARLPSCPAWARPGQP
jgi:energy-coupling factor transporter ATP-binding protein EcfA2